MHDTEYRKKSEGLDCYLNVKQKTGLTLMRCQEYLRDNPLSTWLFSVSFLSAALTIAGHFVTINSVNWAVYVCFSFIQPTTGLIIRSSDKARQNYPFPPTQERIIGYMAAIAAVFSTASFTSLLFLKLAGLKTPDTILVLIAIFFFSSLFAIAMGYVSRTIKIGHRTAMFTAWCFLFVITATLISAAFSTFR